MNMKNIKLLGLALALALLLTGCNLIGTDYKLQADKEIEKIDQDYAVVVASYDGAEVSLSDVFCDYNNAYTNMYNMYQTYFGTDLTHEDMEYLIEDTLKDYVRTSVACAKYDEDNALGDDVLAEVEDEAKSTYEMSMESAIKSVTGENAEARRENARVLLRANGMDYDSIYATLLRGEKMEALDAILRDEITEVTDAELQAAYEEKIETQKSSFADGYSYETAAREEDSLICYRPEGYRSVKHILLIPDSALMDAYQSAIYTLEDTQSRLSSLESELVEANDGEIAEGERDAADIEAELENYKTLLPQHEAAVESAAQACLDDVKAASDEIYRKLEAGESFESLIEAYGEDPGMKNEPTKSRGYAVSAISAQWEKNFRDGAMALESVGDYSAEPVLSGSGVHIILYLEDMPSGETALDEVRDALYDEKLEELKSNHSSETIDGWVEAVNASYDVEAFEAALSI